MTEVSEQITTSVADINSYWQGFVDWLLSICPMLFKALIIFTVGWFLATVLTRIIRLTMEKSKMESSMVSFLGSITGIGLKLLVIVFILSSLGVNIQSMVTAIGAASIAAGLAVKDTLSNMASGASIVFYKPFIIGDFIEFDKISGTVKKIEMMNTTLLTLDNKSIIVPNSMLTANYIINYTKQGYRRLDVTFPIDYNNDIESVKKLIKEIIKTEEKIVNPENSFIAVFDYNEYSVILGIMVWCKNEDYLRLSASIKEKIFLLFDQEKITRTNQEIDINLHQKTAT